MLTQPDQIANQEMEAAARRLRPSARLSLLDWPLTVKNKDYLRDAELCSAGRVRDPSPRESSPHEPLRGHPRRQAPQLFNCLTNHLAGHIIRDFHLSDGRGQNEMNNSAPGFLIREDKP